MLESGGLYVDATAVVGYLKQLETAVLHQNFESGRARINSILNQLLEGVDGGHDNFTSSNLVDYVGVECLPEHSAS